MLCCLKLRVHVAPPISHVSAGNNAIETNQQQRASSTSEAG